MINAPSSPPATDGRRRKPDHGELLQRAIDLRGEPLDQNGRRVGDRSTWPYLLGLTVGCTLLALSAVLGTRGGVLQPLWPVLLDVGVLATFVAGSPLLSDKLLALVARWAARTMRLVSAAAVLLSTVAAAVAAAGLVLALSEPQWTSNARAYLTTTLVTSLLAVGTRLIVTADPAPVTATPMRADQTIRRIGDATSWCGLVLGSAAALSLAVRDSRAVIPLLIGSFLAQVGWSISRSTRLQAALREFAASADALALSATGVARRGTPVGEDVDDLVDALLGVERASVRQFRQSFWAERSPLLVERELLCVLEGARAALMAVPDHRLADPLAATVEDELRDEPAAELAGKLVVLGLELRALVRR
ncbi:hypothetical protein [Nocardioides sp. Leaf285]|uniref:hypothetical protein n=1 Tax=Nocardioides sp. Leaf285 TaxID=1736322 RepID=UPI0012EA014E|nr:hypothetical protein [Nocardioides sp. Leaf285]